MSDILDEIKRLSLQMEPCGSRVTCDPAPTDTDVDYLVLVMSLDEFRNSLNYSTWSQGGSEIPATENILPAEARFLSFTTGPNINIIVTESVIFFKRFMLATHVCKMLNVMPKNHRITVFQAILYGTQYDPYVELPI